MSHCFYLKKKKKRYWGLRLQRVHYLVSGRTTDSILYLKDTASPQFYKQLPRVRFKSVISLSRIWKDPHIISKKRIDDMVENKGTAICKTRKITTFALPHLTSVPMKAMLLLDARSPFVAASWGAVTLEQGVVSPVRLDSSMERSTALGSIKHSIIFKFEDSQCYI